MTEWREVHDSRAEMPETLDKSSSQTTVYERRNIRQETTTHSMGGASVEITEWVYEQREYTREEYTAMTSAANQYIMDALSRIEQATEEIKEVGVGNAAAIVAAVEEGLAL